MPDEEERNRIIRTHQKREAQTERRHLYSFDMSGHNNIKRESRFKEKSGRKHVIRNHRRASNTEFPNYFSGIYLLLLFSMMMSGMASENQQTVRRSAAQTEQIEKGPRNV